MKFIQWCYSGAGHQKPSRSSCGHVNWDVWSCGPHTSSTSKLNFLLVETRTCILFSVFVVDSFMCVYTERFRPGILWNPETLHVSIVSLPRGRPNPGRAGDSLRTEGLMKVDMVRFQGAVLQAVE